MTPNLGQGGCTALEDAVVLARKVSPWFNSSSSSRNEASLATALREYEAERSARCLPLTIRGNLFGAALQIPDQPVLAIRNLVIEKRFNPASFLDHTLYDCGSLQALPPAAIPVVK
jgi:2-polyprenyl-6-methoxyphenol hydroxylase-like FAD-dependent oxidoreductase